MTGSTSRIIHSGRVCEVAKPWTSFRRLATFLRGGALGVYRLLAVGGLWPVGATGARILATMLRELDRREGRYGLETMCIGGGQGLAAIFERVARA